MFSKFCPCLFVPEIVRVSDWESILESGTIGEPTFWESTQASSSLGFSVFTTTITTWTVNWFQKESVRDERKTMNMCFSGRLATQMSASHVLLLAQGMAPRAPEGRCYQLCQVGWGLRTVPWVTNVEVMVDHNTS